MEQWKPCPVRPCYRWRYGPWSACRVEEVACGAGVRGRSLQCSVGDGGADAGAVEEELCGGLELAVDGDPDITLTDTCTLPCPGECYLAEWSSWGPCVSVCVRGAGLDFGSVQVRSRPVMAQDPENLLLCPDQAWQTRPCDGGECYEYKWMRSTGEDSAHLTWCQRSDGLNVTGGCPPVSPPGNPSPNSSCVRPCPAPESFCSEAGVCVCEEGYAEVLSGEGAPERCVPVPVPPETPTATAVTTGRASTLTPPPAGQPGPPQHTWDLQPFGQDGQLKAWVVGVAGGALVLLVFLVALVYLACSYRTIRRSLQAAESSGNGTVVWMGQNAHELTYTCPDCQELAQHSL